MDALALPSSDRVVRSAVSAEQGLLTDEEAIAILRRALGDAVSGAQLSAAVASIHEAVAAKWEQLPPEIHADMGFNYQFLACTETCWLGRQILIEGATFRVFRRRD